MTTNTKYSKYVIKNFYIFQNNVNDQRVHIAFDKYSQKISYCCNTHFLR